MKLSSHEVLPTDASDALLIGRIWDCDVQGPKPVLIRSGGAVDLSEVAPTVSHLLELENVVELLTEISTPPQWTLAELLNGIGECQRDHSQLLSPVDLQVVKACGVTFVGSMVERVIEERCLGDASKSAAMRSQISAGLPVDIASIRPGSQEASALKALLIEQGLWSQYLEVGLGPYPEVFTKAPVLSSVGTGNKIGVASFSSWNNPEPELVLIVDSRGNVRGCSLGNDVNLRDIEGRSALLLGMAKDNNASSAIGPFIRLFDGNFTLDVARREAIHLTVRGPDGVEVLDGKNDVSQLSRPFEELVAATMGAHHQYPDGFALYTGTLFAPVEDRDTPGRGFTHELGDRVEIRSDHLGGLVNEVQHSEDLPAWEFGIASLIDHLSRIARPARTRSADGGGETYNGV